MSHTVTVKNIKLTSPDAIQAAADRLGYTCEKARGQRLYDGTTAMSGTVLRIPGWTYPVLIDENGVAKYDNYGGVWGKQNKLDDFLQNYNTFASKEALEADGWTCGDIEVDENGTLFFETEDRETESW